MSGLAADYPSLVQVIRVGISGEGRELLGVRIGAEEVPEKKGKKGKKGKKEKERSGEKERMGFVITGAQHAREVCSMLPFFRYELERKTNENVIIVGGNFDHPVPHARACSQQYG